ncbi:MAG: ACT domain-containing protein, partial [Acetobacter sp.]
MTTLSPGSKGYILTLSCPDQPGIVAALSQTLFEAGANITEAQQFDDTGSGSFFMRIMFDIVKGGRTEADLRGIVETLTGQFQMQYRLNCQSYRPKVMILVSKFDHCLVDL